MKTLEFHKNTYSIKQCPLCENKGFLKYTKYYYNRYSEQISNLFKISEKSLAKKLNQVKCNKCDLVFKKTWFKNKFLKEIYTKIAPNHPTGWDTISDKFSKENFLIKLNKFNTLVKNNKYSNIISRELISLIEAINFKNKKEAFKKKIIQLIQKKNTCDLSKYKNTILNKINKPKEFSRFDGFKNENFKNYLIDQFPNIESYAEIGCPLWGMLSINLRIKNLNFIEPDYNCFWGINCKNNKKICKYNLNKKIKVFKLSEVKKKIDLICAFNYLDHLINIKYALKKLIIKSKALAIILENTKRGYPIQHALGINKNTINYMALKYKRKVYTCPQLFNKTKYSFYLLKDFED